MKRIQRKWTDQLADREGASIVLALVAFVVASMVSVTLITAAVTTSKRVHSDREVQQIKLTLDSAAELLRNEMNHVKYMETTTVTKVADEDPVTTVTATAAGTLKEEIKKAVSYVDTYHTDFKGDASTQLCIHPDDTELQPVDATFTMKSDADDQYNVVFTLNIRGQSETVYLSMYGNKKTRSSNTTTKADGTVVVETIEEITWGSGTIS